MERIPLYYSARLCANRLRLPFGAVLIVGLLVLLLFLLPNTLLV